MKQSAMPGEYLGLPHSLFSYEHPGPAEQGETRIHGDACPNLLFTCTYTTDVWQKARSGPVGMAPHLLLLGLALCH